MVLLYRKLLRTAFSAPFALLFVWFSGLYTAPALLLCTGLVLAPQTLKLIFLAIAVNQPTGTIKNQTVTSLSHLTRYPHPICQ